MPKAEYDQIGSEYEVDIDYEVSQRVSSWANHESEPLLYEPEETKLKFFPAMAIIVASMTGVGVLAFPSAFVLAGGCVNAILLQLPFLALAWVTMNAIGLVIRKYDVDEYEHMVSAALGERTGQICKVFFFVYCLANCTAYCLVIIDQGKAFFYFLPELAPLIAVVLFPFSCVENVAFLKYSGYVSISAMLVLVATVIMDYFLLPMDSEIIVNATLAIPNPHPESIPDPDFSSMFSSFPIFCFAYQGHMSSVKVYRRIEHPKKYPWITACAFLVTFVLYNTCSVFAVMTYGATIDPDMLNSYPLTDIPMYCARIGIIGCLMGAYPVFTLLARDMLYKSNNPRFRYCFSSVWFICALGAAMVIPDFQMASAMIGSLAALLMFVFPGVALLVSFTNRKFYRCLLGLFCVVFGTFLFGFAFTNSLM